MVWRVLTRKEMEKTKERFAPQGYVAQWYAMGSEVILSTLGPGWWKKNCDIESIKADEFLSLKDNFESARGNRQDRVVRLGHMLYALKECAGYDAFISSLRARDLAPVFFELWAANALYNNNYSVEFVVAKGSKGQDYDLIGRKAGVSLNVEVKSRRDGITLAVTGLKNTLEKARKQLPSTGPGAIFISIPHEWTRETGVDESVAKSIDSFFNRSARVNHVVLIWWQWGTLHDEYVSTVYFREYENPRPRTPYKLTPLIRAVKLPDTLSGLRQSFQPSFW
jgi:hypothetical protein